MTKRHEEWREGVVNVLDHEGNYLGCMGSETWAWMLDGGIAKLKERLKCAETTLAHAEAFIEHQDMNYRWAEWCEGRDPWT